MQKAPGALLLHTFNALAPACFPYQIFSVVKSNKSHVFAALFQGHNGPQAAALAADQCYSVFTIALYASCDQPETALRETFLRLDEIFLASDLDPRIRASVGASAVMLYINLANNRVYVARLGGCRCILSKASITSTRTAVSLQHIVSVGLSSLRLWSAGCLSALIALACVAVQRLSSQSLRLRR